MPRYSLFMSLWERWYYHVWCRWRYPQADTQYACAIATAILSLYTHTAFSSALLYPLHTDTPDLHTGYYRILRRVLPLVTAPYLISMYQQQCERLSIHTRVHIAEAYTHYIDHHPELFTRLPPYQSEGLIRHHCRTFLYGVCTIEQD